MKVENTQVQGSECVLPDSPSMPVVLLGYNLVKLAAFILLHWFWVNSDMSVYCPLDKLDLRLNVLPLGENHFLMELPTLASHVASTNATISFHFTLS